jgi:peptidoglycan/xylan/chitin deacetylase (PgdA/CDA1 family)
MAIQPDLLLRQVRALARIRSVRVSFDDAFRSASTVFPALARMGLPLQIFVCTGFAGDGAPLTIPEFAGDDREQLATMTWDDLRAHAAAGVAIGSHGVTHAHLTRLGDDELRSDLVQSKQQIEDELGSACTELAYPYGEHDERVRAAARAAGYDRAYGLRERGRDPYALPRLDLYRRHGPVRALLRLHL